ERLIGDILAVSRIDSGRVSVDLSRVDVASVVQHVCDEVSPMLKGRSLKCRLPEDLPAVMGEARKLHQILVNLVNNAIKYSEPGTQITLSARGDPSAVRFEVSDQGVGIRKEHMPRLFEKFYRADDPAVRRTAGTGPGRYGGGRRVTLRGGQHAARSRQGRGTVSTATAPRAETPARTRPRPAGGAN